MDSVAKEWAEVQQGQAMAESDKKQLVKLTVCAVSCKRVHHFVDQENEDLEPVEYEHYLTEK